MPIYYGWKIRDDEITFVMRAGSICLERRLYLDIRRSGLSAYAVFRVAGIWLGYGLTPEGSVVR